MNLKYWLLAIVILLLVATALAASRPGEEFFLVQISSSGFTPKQLEIHAGDTIRFENNGSGDHWPASDVHPTHERYPGLDPHKPLLPGEVWQFVFEQSGVWTLHDHLSPEKTATIKVIEAESKFVVIKSLQRSLYSVIEYGESGVDWITSLFKVEQNTTIQDLGFNQEFHEPESYTLQQLQETTDLPCQQVSFDCINTVLLGLTTQYGPRAAMEILQHWQLTDMVSRTVDDHQLAHRIGRETARSFGVSVSSFLLCQMDMFNGGCQHGYFEYILGRTPTAIEAGTAICEQLQGDTFSPKTHFYCYHGVGHGVMMAAAYDLYASLAVCDSFGSGIAQAGCWQGVFMENINGALAGQSGEDLFSDDDPLAPCNKLEEKYQHECYINHAGWLIKVFKNQVRGSTLACLDAGDQTISCLQSIGLMVTNPSWQPALAHDQTNQGFSQTAWNICDEFPEGYIDQCMLAGVDNILNFDVRDLRRADEFCQAAPTDMQQACYYRVGVNTHENSITDTEIELTCASLDPEAHTWCLQGGGQIQDEPPAPWPN